MLLIQAKGSEVRRVLVGSILLSMATVSVAASLGRHSGAIVIGRPLDIRVQALSASDEDISSKCTKAEVLFGDSPVGPASVRTSMVRSTPDAETSIRVQTTIPVNEPIVSVVVTAGCTASFSRRYVILADLQSEPVSTTALPSGASPVADLPNADASTLPPMAQPSSGTQARARDASTSPRRASVPRASGASEMASALPREKPASVVRKPAPTAKDAVPRLQLDPVDMSLAIERDPVLRLSLSLLSEPTSNEQERAAAAQLWKALNASPEDILRDTQKLSVLEAEAKGLRDQEAKNKAALDAMQAQLDRSRYMTWLTYLLGALLLLALLGLYWLFKRRAKAEEVSGQKQWWASGSGRAASVGAAASVREGTGSKRAALDIDLDDESGLDELMSVRGGLGDDSEAALLTGSDARGFPHSQMAVSRSVATEELFDLQQQSDFFVSLGEYEKAVGVLKTHIAESPEPSALAYLDLLKLYHVLGRQSDYDQLRTEFNRQFNASAPAFDQYSNESRGLETYEGAIGRIQALWPQARVLDVIENSIFRDASDGEGEVFDLEAYRELLLLHAIAKEVIHRDTDFVGADFQHTSIRPLKAGAHAAVGSITAGGFAVPTQPLDNFPPASPRLGLDVDLDALHEASAFEASLPDVDVLVEPTAKSLAASKGAGDQRLPSGNLIDFEVLDFMPPEDGPKPSK